MKQSASHEETHRSQLNNSRFKQLYSFPKASRFASHQQVLRAPYYDNKITAMSNRSTSFGFGNKFTLENKNPFPPPNSYQRVSSFQEAVEKRRGYSFTHEQKKDSPALTPGPGKYECNGDRQDFKRVSYSLRQRLNDPLSRTQNVKPTLLSHWDLASTQPFLISTARAVILLLNIRAQAVPRLVTPSGSTRFRQSPLVLESVSHPLCR